MVRIRVIYTGKVQGVGFRATARECARAAGVTGFVRNEEDGSVLMEAQGPDARVRAALAAIRQARAGFIRGERVEPIPTTPDEREFIIAR